MSLWCGLWWHHRTLFLPNWGRKSGNNERWKISNITDFSGPVARNELECHHFGKRIEMLKEKFPQTCGRLKKNWTIPTRCAVSRRRNLASLDYFFMGSYLVIIHRWPTTNIPQTINTQRCIWMMCGLKPNEKYNFVLIFFCYICSIFKNISYFLGYIPFLYIFICTH